MQKPQEPAKPPLKIEVFVRQATQIIHTKEAPAAIVALPASVAELGDANCPCGCGGKVQHAAAILVAGTGPELCDLTSSILHRLDASGLADSAIALFLAKRGNVKARIVEHLKAAKN